RRRLDRAPWAVRFRLPRGLPRCNFGGFVPACGAVIADGHSGNGRRESREELMARLVKRYGNRKLYDTSESRYVTLDEIGRWVKAGEEVKILENDTGEDLTAVTFAQIILEEERRKSGLLSLRMLREIIQHGEAALQGLAATADRGMGVIRSAPERAGRSMRELTQVAERLGQLQRAVDETVRRSVERVTNLPAFQKEMRRIERSMKALEARIARLRPGGTDGVPPPTDPPAGNG